MAILSARFFGTISSQKIVPVFTLSSRDSHLNTIENMVGPFHPLLLCPTKPTLRIHIGVIQ